MYLVVEKLPALTPTQCLSQILTTTEILNHLVLRLHFPPAHTEIFLLYFPLLLAY